MKLSCADLFYDHEKRSVVWATDGGGHVSSGLSVVALRDCGLLQVKHWLLDG